MIEEFSFLNLFAIVIIFIANIFTIFTILKSKNANGISKWAFVIASIACIYPMLFTNNTFVFIFVLIDFIFCIIISLMVFYYHYKTNYEFKEDFKILSTASTFSFFGVAGVAQFLKSIKTIGIKSSVSFTSYGLFAFSKYILILNETKLYVLIPMYITFILFSLISLISFYSNVLKKV